MFQPANIFSPTIKDITRSLLLVAVIGLATGVLTSFGQTYLPGDFKQFANCYSVWLSVSFLVGLLVSSARQALIGGSWVQVFALIGYYLASFLRFAAGPGDAKMIAFWLVGGVIVGPVLGWLGYQWRHRQPQAWYAGPAVAALYISEGAYLLHSLGYRIGYLFIVLGLVLGGVLYRKGYNLRLSVTICFGSALLFFLAYTYLFGWLYTLLT